MKFAFNRSASLNSLVLAGLLATVGTSAIAQAPAPQPAATAPAGERMARHDPTKMQAWVAKRQADLKAKLKITPAQESAWTAFTASMQPPARDGMRPTPEQRAEFEKLTAPQRIDKMRALRTEHHAKRSLEMDKRGDAVKTFYAALTPEQQKTFDAEHKNFGPHHGAGKGHGGPGHEGRPAPERR